LFTYSYGYDPLGRPASISYPAPAFFSDLFPFKVTFDYTAYGAMQAVRDTTRFGSGATFWKNTVRNEFDQITREEFANGAVTTRQADNRGRLWQLSTTSNGVPIQDLT
jgi:hypothetical protein